MVLARDIDTGKGRVKFVPDARILAKQNANLTEFKKRISELEPWVKSLTQRSKTSWQMVLHTQEAFMLYPKNRRCKNYSTDHSVHYGSFDELINWINNREYKITNAIENARNQREALGIIE